MKIAIMGKGNVGSALAEGLKKTEHEVRFVPRESGEAEGTLRWSDVVILAVPWTAHGSIAETAGAGLEGKTVVDVSNVLTTTMELALGFTTSGAEELQKLLPRVRVVKAFNTVFAQNMPTGTVGGETLTVFLAGDGASSKEQVRTIAEGIGFECIDAGPLRSARYLESLGMLNITLGYGLGMGTDIGIALVRKGRRAARRAA